MRTVDLIEKKRNGGVLTDEEIRFLIGGYTDGTFKPNNNITRGQMAKILYNLI